MSLSEKDTRFLWKENGFTNGGVRWTLSTESVQLRSKTDARTIHMQCLVSYDHGFKYWINLLLAVKF